MSELLKLAQRHRGARQKRSFIPINRVASQIMSQHPCHRVGWALEKQVCFRNPVAVAEKDVPSLDKRKIVGTVADDHEVRLLLALRGANLHQAGLARPPRRVPRGLFSPVAPKRWRPESLSDELRHRNLIDRTALHERHRWSLRKTNMRGCG
jgi:hypothetical protein